MTGCVVVKIGGEVVDSPTMMALATDITGLRDRGVPVVVVHGGGPQVTQLQRRLGQTPAIVGGRRITDAATLEVIKMVVAGKVNVDACAALIAAGARPVGLHGASALVIEAARRPPRVVTGGGPEPIDFGHVGDITSVNGKLISLLTEAGYVPVIACLGADAQGRVYNINADTVATRIASAIDARALILVSDVAGVLRDVSDPSSRIGRLSAAAAKRAIADGTIGGGMIPKIEESLSALAHGVRAVHIVGQVRQGDLAREVSDPGSLGTIITP
jgi:acetylglutamate kinase